MRIVVVGATGNIGTALRAALEKEHDVVGVARRATGNTVAADVTVDDLVPLFRGADAVVHLAWLFQPTHQPLVTWRVNVLGSLRVFQAVVDAGVPALVYSSSVGAYSPGPQDRAVDESWPTHSLPTAAYGREKAYVERLLDAVEARNPQLRVVRLRPGFVFQRAAASEQRRLFAGPFVPRFLLEPGRLPALPVPAGLRFQALHATDAAEAFRLAVTSDARGAFNVAAEPVVDADALAEALGSRAVAVPRGLVRGVVAAAWALHLGPAAPALLDLVLSLPRMDTTRIRGELGWRPRYTAVEALAEAFQGMAEGAGGPTPPLAPDSPAGRAREVVTGVGERP